MEEIFTGRIRGRKAVWYRKTLKRMIKSYYKKLFFTARDKYSSPAIPAPNNYVDGYTIFETTLPALLTMSAINFFKIGITLHAKKYAEEMWYCRKLIRKAARVEDESMERMDAFLKARFGKTLITTTL